jgi:hypothetical protein
MNNEPLEREPIDRMRARLEALLKANAAPRCGARSKRTGKPCRGAAMPNGRCKLHGGKSTGARYSTSRRPPPRNGGRIHRLAITQRKLLDAYGLGPHAIRRGLAGSSLTRGIYLSGALLPLMRKVGRPVACRAR